MRRQVQLSYRVFAATLAMSLTPAMSSAQECGCDEVACACDGGLLGCHPLSKNGPIHAVLGTLAGGIEHVAVGVSKFRLPHACASDNVTSCDEGCDAWFPEPKHGPGIPVAPSGPVNPSPVFNHQPFLAPVPATAIPMLPQPAPLDSIPTPPAGSTFDQMTDPFQDDSANLRRASVQPIRQATFKEDDVYDDYFE